MSAANSSARPETDGERVFSSMRIAEILTVPPASPLTPTPEQRRVIEHPLGSSTLVVAGAGSGKTETMANRVVWLVANGLVAPDQVLGLTFTRKAAGELRERISSRLAAFAHRLQDHAERGLLSDTEAAHAVRLTEFLADGLELPEVSTYNAFAAGALQEFGIAAGIAPGSVIIDEATAWRIARETILQSEDPALVESELRLSQLVNHVLSIDHAVADNLTSFGRVDQVVAEFGRVLELPYSEKERSDESGGKPSGRVYAPVRDAVANLAETPLITRLAREFAAEKQRRGVLEFSDQLSFATRAIEESGDAVSLLRQRHRVVLLDEVQDTSVGQTRFLSRIFAGRSVMAVGDPHQSIYGWRGASAEGLQSFHNDFRGRAAAATSAAVPTTLTLSTSWRNPGRVLDVANIIAAPLAADAAVEVPKLAPRPGAALGSVEWLFPETIHEERYGVAAWMRDAREAHFVAQGEYPSAAIIFRKRSAMAGFAVALSEFGVPNRIVGLGGLLTTPEVTDVVSVLRCLWYADANTELIRLLTGPRFRLGVADVAGLRDAARWFARRDVSQQQLSAEAVAADRVLPDPDRIFTLVDGLDQIATMRDLNHVALKSISTVGRERLRQAGRMLATLRQGVGGNIGELMNATVQALRLDIELAANEARHHIVAADAYTNLDVFTELIEGYLAVDTRGTLASLLEWIERATAADETAEHVAAPKPGTVHLITAHGAKGLEWDLVAVPRMVAGEFPGQARSGAGWLRTGELPDELRGDAAARPKLNWRISATQQELRDRIADYREQLKERHADEERRLAYVAVTRSAERLLLSGSFWGGQTRARPPSPFLRELDESGLLGESLAGGHLVETSGHDSDPSELAEMTMQWPLDPLGARAGAVLNAAEAVRRAMAEASSAVSAGVSSDASAGGADSGDEVVQLLLAERRIGMKERVRAVARVELPSRITASTFHEFVEDPASAERHRLRPVPQRPYRRTRIGNRFHEWVERRATTARGTELPLFEPEQAHEPELQPLIEQFERSRWVDLKPIAVEQEVTMPFAGRSLVCKLDAVYRLEGETSHRYEIVDWKAGRSPRNDEERRTRFFQLDLYRHAYAQWANVDPAQIDVSLFYVAEGVELRGGVSRSLLELEQIWLEAARKLSSGIDPETPVDARHQSAQ